MLSKATKRFYFLKLLKRAGVPCAQLQHFCVAVIRPILEYAAPVWHHLIMNCHSDQIEAIQKRGINIIHGPTHGMPYSNALHFAGLTSLRARREQVARNFFESLLNQLRAFITYSHLHETLKSSHDWERLLNIFAPAIGQKCISRLFHSLLVIIRLARFFSISNLWVTLYLCILLVLCIFSIV